MTRSEQCNYLGRLLGALVAKRGRKQVGPSLLANIATLPSSWRLRLTHVLRDIGRDKDLAEMAAVLSAETIGAGGATLQHQSDFWLGYYHEQADRAGIRSPVPGAQTRNAIQKQITMYPEDIEMLAVLAKAPEYGGKMSRVVQTLIRSEFATHVKTGEISNGDSAEPEVEV